MSCRQHEEKLVMSSNRLRRTTHRTSEDTQTRATRGRDEDTSLDSQPSSQCVSSAVAISKEPCKLDDV